MAFRLFLFFTLSSSLFTKTWAQTFPEWSVFDSRKKEVAHVFADSVAGFSREAVLLYRGNKMYFASLQGKLLTDSLDSVSVQFIHGEAFTLAVQAGERKLLNSHLQTLASGLSSIRFFDETALVKNANGYFEWIGLSKAVIAPPNANLDSVKVFPKDVVLGRAGAQYFWLHPDVGLVPLQIPKSVPLSSIKSAIEISSGKTSYLALLQSGMVRMFSRKGAALAGATKAFEMRPALNGIIFKNTGEWYYQDPAKTLPTPLKGNVISADQQKIIVSRSNKFFAFWKGGRATWLKLETADSVGRFCSGLARFRYKGKYGFIDSLGYIRISARYQAVADFENGMSIIRAAGKWGVIDKRENFVIQPFNDSIWTSKGLFAQQSADRVFLFNPSNGAVSESYDSLAESHSGFTTYKSGKQGYLNTKAKTILATRFDLILEIGPLNTVAYRQNARWYFPEGTIGKIHSARKISVSPETGYTFIQPVNLN